jgi:hypothetical protein
MMKFRMITANIKAILFNAAAVVVVLGALIGIGRSMLGASTSTPCGDRNENSIAFRIEQDGAVLTGADILARVGHDSVGVIENLDVVRPRDTRIPAAMRISLRNGPAQLDGSVETKAGVAFPWEPRSIRKQATACLSYKVFFEGDLEFHAGGTLPGIQGRDESQQSQDGFASHMAWREDGQPGVTLSVTASGKTQTAYFEARPTFPRGQWIRIDKEVALNTPGQDNGILRVWVDGVLAIERTNIAYRGKPEINMSGVGANVFYGAARAMASPPSDTTIWVSPFEISWR